MKKTAKIIVFSFGFEVEFELTFKKLVVHKIYYEGINVHFQKNQKLP